jgi:hypothetical protein
VSYKSPACFSATATTAVFAIGACLRPAATGGITFSQQGINYRRGAAHTGFHVNRVRRAIFAAGSALHAGIAITDSCAPSVHYKNLMRAHFQAPAAARASVFIQL